MCQTDYHGFYLSSAIDFRHNKLFMGILYILLMQLDLPHHRSLCIILELKGTMAFIFYFIQHFVLEGFFLSKNVSKIVF